MKNNYFEQLKQLLNNAKPIFSNIKVAAVIIANNGTYYGVNYEDSIPLLSTCAERNAIFNGITNGMKEVYEVHILSDHDGMTMCGTCRQLLSSFAEPECKIYNYDLKGEITETTLKKLLPDACYLAKNKNK